MWPLLCFVFFKAECNLQRDGLSREGSYSTQFTDLIKYFIHWRLQLNPGESGDCAFSPLFASLLLKTDALLVLQRVWKETNKPCNKQTKKCPLGSCKSSTSDDIINVSCRTTIMRRGEISSSGVAADAFRSAVRGVQTRRRRWQWRASLG